MNRPLSTVPYPDDSGDDMPEVSQWDDGEFPYYSVKRLDPMLLSFVRPCQVGSFLTISELSGSHMKALVSTFPRLAYRIDVFRDKMLSSVPDKMYCYAVAQTYKARPFDFVRRNKTAFAGLQNNMPNSYINSMIQMLYFMPAVRGAVRKHLCTRDYCLTCELAFLFHMLDGARPMNGATFTTRNFVRSFRQIPQAVSLSLVEQPGSTSHTELPTLLVQFASFLIGQMDAEMTSPKQVSHTVGTRPVVLNNVNPTLSQQFSLKKHTSLHCPNCSSNWENDSSSMFLDFIVPTVVEPSRERGSETVITTTDVVTSSSLQDGTIDFATILERSFHRIYFNKTWCEHCKHLQQVEQHRDLRSLPPTLLLSVGSLKDSDCWPGPNAGKVTINGTAVISPWLPLSIEIEVDSATGEPHVVGAAGRPSSASSGPTTTSVYELTAVISHVLDQSPLAPSSGNLVAHIRVPARMAEAHGAPVNGEGEGVDGGWYLFNDFQVTQTSAAEAVRFPSWKRPCFIAYTKRSAEPIPPEQPDLLLDCSLFLNPLLLNQKHRVAPVAFHHESQLPNSGELVAIDSEFVSLSATGVVSELDGTHTTITPSNLSVARVSCVFGQGASVGRPLIDDYIFTPEPVVDYLTRFSGVTPRDLDPMTTNKRLVPFKDVYLKLRYLVDRGCILVGHGLANDFGVIGIHVPRDQYIDTVELFHKPRNRWISLRFLTSLFIATNIQEDVHCSLEDAKSVCNDLPSLLTSVLIFVSP